MKKLTVIEMRAVTGGNWDTRTGYAQLVVASGCELQAGYVLASGVLAVQASQAASVYVPQFVYAMFLAGFSIFNMVDGFHRIKDQGDDA